MAFGKWDPSLGHDRLTAEHNAVGDAVDALANALREIERSVAAHEHDMSMRVVCILVFCGEVDKILPLRTTQVPHDIARVVLHVDALYTW